MRFVTEDGRFTIATGQPHVKVVWRISGGHTPHEQEKGGSDMKRALVVLAVLAVVLVPAASARSGVRVKLSVLPLPKAVIGSAAKSLRLQADSYGVRPSHEFLLGPIYKWYGNGAIEATLATLGRIKGHALDYGLGASGGAGVTEVWTSVDEYKTSAGARKGLAFWKGSVLRPTRWGRISVAVKKQKVAAVGRGRFAILVSYKAANIKPLFGLDEQFTEGRYEAEVTVWAGTAAAAKRLAPTLAQRLDARIKQAVAGKLHAKPVTIPPGRNKGGPPPGGPDLASLALKTTDLNGPAAEPGPGNPGYFTDYDPALLSGYGVEMDPAGQFDTLTQGIEWYPTANLARFTADYTSQNSGPATAVDLSSIGDGARGFLDGNGAQIVFSSGQLEEGVYFERSSTIQPSEVQKIAQTVANYINAAGLGS
jgi:hypothetical protein